MKDSGREPGRKDSDKPGKAGKNDRGKRDRKLRDTLGNPFLWLVPFLLVVILGWAVFSQLMALARYTSVGSHSAYGMGVIDVVADAP